MEAERIPVIVGVGQVNDRPEDYRQGLDSSELMTAALRRAEQDGGGGWLGKLDALAVVAQISWPGLDPLPERIAAQLGIAPRLLIQTVGPMGDSPVRLLDEAAARIARGETRIEAVTGGEALRTAARHARHEAGTDPMQQRAAERPKGYAQRYGLVSPVDVYPLYENAGRAAYGQTVSEGQAESAELWAGMSRVAAANPHAWLRGELTAADIATPGADNRPIAFPYLKRMVANASVNQGAGFIVSSLAEARRRGVAEERLVYVGAGAGAREPDDIMTRTDYVDSASLRASIVGTLERNGIRIEQIDHVELYSCFPCVVKMARRVLDWPIDRPITAFGGLTFGGGPIGNYMSHAIASMVEVLRRDGTHGLLFGNGGFATYNHSIILSRDPALAVERDERSTPAIRAAQGEAPQVDETYRGSATIETYTIFYDRTARAVGGVVVARTPAGRRALAHVPAHDDEMTAFLTNGNVEPVGTQGLIVGEEERAEWRRHA